MSDTSLPMWFNKGLSFKCTGCGQCCTGAPGYVWISPEEVAAMAEYLNLPEPEFVKRYVRLVDGHFSLKEHPKTYDCVFLKEKKCTVYPVRPKQCQTFPWWTENLRSPEAWNEAASRCEGINHPDAPVIPFEEIAPQVQ